MTEATCAACDCPLDEHAFQVTIAGRRVEVCCEECARKLDQERCPPVTPVQTRHP